MLQYFDSATSRDIMGELAQTVHEVGTFIKEHQLMSLAVVVLAVVLWRWAATPSHR